jgi:DNA-binding transcriptional LysR family regulator
MNIKQLETFVWIVRLGSFSAAAEHLYTTQSTVSSRIRELEEQLGIELFDRSHHKAPLTAKGQELLAYAETLLALTSEIRHRVGDPKTLFGVVRVGVAEVVAKTWLARLVTVVTEKYPRVKLEIDMDLTTALIGKVRDGNLDLALIPGPVVEPNLTSRFLGRVRFAWMASPKLDIPRKAITPAELQQWPFISLSKDSHHYHTIESWCASKGVQMSSIVSCNNMSVAGDLTIAGLGVSHLPLNCYADDIKAGRLRVVETRPAMPAVEFFVTSLRGRFEPVTDAVSALARQLCDFPRS